MPLPTNISASTRRLNPQIFSPLGPKADPAGPITSIADAKKRLRQKSGPKMNKTEQAFFDYLQATMPDYQHHAQSVTFSIANGCRYTPDVMSVHKLTLRWIASEIKGFARDDAIVKLKCFATQYPSIQVRLVTKNKDGGGWAIEPVLP